jgi:hypothetical protein
VSITTAGVYNITFSTSVDIFPPTTSSVRFICKSYLEFYDNSNSSWNVIPGTVAYSYHRTYNEGEGTATNTCMYNLSVNDKIRVRVQRHRTAGSGTILKTIANSCSLTMLKL